MDIQALAKQIPAEGEHSLEGVDFIINGDQYLTFQLGTEQYALDILSVEEIRSWEQPTLIPNSPAYVKGVINMRGIIVPIIDLRMKFRVGEPTYTELTVVIVLHIDSEEGERKIGFVVDAVSDVLNAEEKEIKKAPNFGGLIPAYYVRGLINVGDNLVTLLNLQALNNIEPHKTNGMDNL